MNEFPAELICISPSAQNEWDLAIEVAEHEYETEFDGKNIAKMLDDGDLIITTESSDGSSVSIRIRGKHWEPLYKA